MEQDVFFRRKILNLASEMLSLAESEFSRHGCNDVDNSLYSQWTMEEKANFARCYHQWNESRLEPIEDSKRPEELPDFAIMGFLAAYLSGQLNEYNLIPSI